MKRVPFGIAALLVIAAMVIAQQWYIAQRARVPIVVAARSPIPAPDPAPVPAPSVPTPSVPAPSPLPQIQLVTTDPGFPVKTFWGLIEGKAPRQTPLQRYLRLFNSEFALYPADLVRKSGTKRIVFCENLQYAKQYRGAVPDFEHDTLYLDVSRGAYSRLYQREGIHHEFFHIIDYRDDGQLYTDPAWSALNPKTFHYGTGGVNDQGNPMAGVWTDRYPGFLDQYSTTGVEEDKAEVFACMMVDPPYMKLRADKDPVLATKVTRMKKLLNDFCPSIDDSFWIGISKHQVSENAHD